MSDKLNFDGARKLQRMQEESGLSKAEYFADNFIDCELCLYFGKRCSCPRGTYESLHYPFEEGQMIAYKETDFPYYMNEGNYYKGNHHNVYQSFSEFKEEWCDDDVDLNRIHRYDIKTDDDGNLHLFTYYILQRKAILLSCECPITPDDMPSVAAFLLPHKILNDKLWSSPF